MADENVYISQPKPGFCACCGFRRDTRVGICFDCAECESVIAEGLDMHDKPIPKLKGFSSHMAKVRYILKKHHANNADV